MVSGVHILDFTLAVVTAAGYSTVMSSAFLGIWRTFAVVKCEPARSMRDRLIWKGYRSGSELFYLAFPEAKHDQNAWAA